MTVQTGEDFLHSSPLKTDICIVGTGPAGVTLAWHLKKNNPNLDVTLLEGSRLFGRDPNMTFTGGEQAYMWNENDALYNGVTKGLMAQNEPDFLIRPTPLLNNSPTERERIYGGTSTHWGAQSRPLDPITFKQRPGFSGWPITREDMDDYYDQACRFCDLHGDYYVDGKDPGYNFTAEYWAKELGIAPESLQELEGFDVSMYQFFNDHQFQAKKLDGETTIGDSDVRVIVNASLLDMAKEDTTVSQLTVGVMQGERGEAPSKLGEFTINADVVVLACGAVANARQLLLSGFGETNDNIGAYFMCHPGGYGRNLNAIAVSPSLQNSLVGYRNVQEFYNIYAIKGVYTPQGTTAEQEDIGLCWLDNNGSGNFYHEMLPWKESRISLADSTDLFGQRQTQIDWQLNPGSEQNYKKITDLYQDSVNKINPHSSFTIKPWQDVERNLTVNGHHLGTTRMGTSEKDAVVDKNLKVFGTDNLYVAGSSVWATAGVSNPTFSIITFSIRLAEHIGKNFSK